MSSVTVLVTGVPGSGKTTLARQLAACLELPLLSMDVIKESLFASLGVRDRAWSLQLRAASLDVLWSLLPDCPYGAVVDIWLDPTRDQGVAAAGLARAGAGRVLEVLCDVRGEVAAARYAARDRHPGHLPPDRDTLTRIMVAADLMAPLDLGPAFRVDTSVPVDIGALVGWLQAAR